MKAHRAYIDGLGWDDFDEEEMLEGFSRPVGSRLGVAYAAPFEVYSLRWGGGDEDEVGALTAEALGEGPTDAGGCSGDECGAHAGTLARRRARVAGAPTTIVGGRR